jgi:hypothetical protein
VPKITVNFKNIFASIYMSSGPFVRQFFVLEINGNKGDTGFPMIPVVGRVAPAQI